MKKSIRTSNFQYVALFAAALILSFGTGRALAQRAMGMDSDFNCCSVNWTNAANGGIQFACIKATAQDEGFQNSEFATRMQGAHAAGIYTVPYNRVDPSSYTPASEAAYFWNFAGSSIYGRGYNLSPAIDVEDGLTGTYKKDGGGTQSLAAWCNQYYSDLASDAAAVGVAMQQVTYINVGITCDIGTGLGGYLWLADPCCSNSPTTGNPYTCGGCSLSDTWDGCEPTGSETWNIWQYDWDATISGPAERVDLDVYNGTMDQMVSTLGVGHISPCVATTYDGRLELFAVGENGGLYHDYQGTNFSGGWSGWIALNSSTSFSQNTIPAVGVNADGRLEVFVINSSNGGIYHLWQLTPGSSASTNWSSFASLGGQFGVANKLAVGNWANGTLDLFVIGSDFNLYHNWQVTNGWNGFVSLGSGGWSQDQDIAVNNELDGRLDVILTFNNGVMYNDWQTTTNSTSWNGWNRLPGSGFSQVARTALGCNSDGRLQVFTFENNSNTLFTLYETNANNPASWSGPYSMSGSGVCNSCKPVVANDENGCLELLMVNASNGGMYAVHQTTPGGTWSSFLSLGGTFAQSAQPCIGVNPDGRLEVFASIGTGKGMYHDWEITVNGTNSWSGWNSLGGNFW